ncbi:VWA domain-containing protein [Kaustia mangrovi]|uniref:VWA domain-containing protein n=1 Tax=Kaustia mangrovi TaxID=2593653 RepID=A0A7S8HAU8_9HYPH|nr:VWA domain-containing protein [Kaustia mangrovi]QPC41458.1 VWA domain-containing protein [Kaustia mangrovi]
MTASPMSPQGPAGPDDEGGRLAENIVHFARLLREAGLSVGPGQILDALQAARAGCLRGREDFYWALHSVFVTARDQHPVFDQAFKAFWRQPRMLEQLMALMLPEIAIKANPPKKRSGERRLGEAMFDEANAPKREQQQEVELDASFSFSADELLRRKDFEQMSVEEQAEARAAIARLRLDRVEVPTRRFTPSHAGTRVDLRRTMRSSLRSGGNLIDLQWRARQTREPPLVVLCDISGSMSGYTRMFLHFLHALTNDRDRVQVFLFGTRLTNITRQLERRDVDEALDAVSETVEDWSGGTRIGHCLREFNYLWARRVLTQGAHVLIITDGLDREDAGDLELEMARLKRAARRVVWLNPLLRFDGFEARARGIRTMLPHVDEFRPVHNLESLEDLASALSYSRKAEYDPRRWLEKARAA